MITEKTESRYDNIRCFESSRASWYKKEERRTRAELNVLTSSQSDEGTEPKKQGATTRNSTTLAGGHKRNPFRQLIVCSCKWGDASSEKKTKLTPRGTG
ncbi:hypothetical protein TNCV_2092531 [Trichonephila clavipes]|nr:hypothetical protein TNCV_2092531 [Trichonephila clavipes]